MTKRSKGEYFEGVASDYLKRLNYQILHRNFQTHYGEIDIIAKYDEEYLFIEVKSLSMKSDYSIYKSVNKRKYLRIQKAAQRWLRMKKVENKTYRIEFIGILHQSDKMYLEHFKYFSFN